MLEAQQSQQETQTSRNNNGFGVPSKLLTLIVAISLLFGAIGGAVGSLYLSTLPAMQKYFPIKSAPASINQEISLTEDSAIVDVVKKASPAVVSIVITKDLSKVPGFGFSPFEDFFFPFPGRGNTQQQAPNIQQVGAGSGFFVSKDGLVVTNKHVVSDDQAQYTIITSDNKTYEARVLSRDPVNDLALIKVEAQDAPYLSFADSSSVEIGQRVVAIGNSLGEYQNTVTSGIISGIGRSITAGSSEGREQLEGVIQTDAAINPGNSGGPLLNTAGQVVGVNTAIDQQGQSVGFAIPSNDVSRALSSFEKNGRITRPYLGVRYVMITKALAEQQKLPREYGALILRGESMTDFAVLPGSPADKAGLSENDIILEVNGTKLENDNTLSRMLRERQPGDQVTLKVYHRGEEKEVKVTLEETK